MAKYLDYAGLEELVSKLKSYVDGAVSAFDLFIVVTSLPTSGIQTNKIYLVPDPNAEQDNAYDEYAYVDGKWELLGSVVLDTDLSNYLTKEDAAATYATKEEVPTKLSDLDNDEGFIASDDMVAITTAEVDELFE